MATAPSTAPARQMQGIAVPAESVNPREFFARTRRHIGMEKQFSYTGQPQETVELRKADILSGITIRFSGQVAVTGAVVTSSARWPYDFIKAAKLSANGASNIINVSGAKLKARDLMKKSDLTDRGVSQTIGGTARTQGTLARGSESWGVGSATTGIAVGTYGVELEWFVPVAEDEVDLAGAIFLATSSSDLTLQLDLATVAELFSGAGVAAITGNFQIITTKFSIPVGPSGQIVVPDLSMFHSLIQSRVAGGIQNGENEFRIIGQGAGKSLLRIFYQVWNGAGTAAAPLAMTTTNFGKQAIRWGNNETPDEFIDGNHMRIDTERRYNADLGGVQGFGCHDFAHENTFRDVIDMGTTSELRFIANIQSGVVLTSPAVEYVTETVFLAGQSA